MKGASVTLSNPKQAHTLASFRQGSTNVVFSTSIAEEGLDVQHCSLVICYDVPIRPISIVQTVGRARARDAIVRFMQSTNPDTGRAEHVRPPLFVIAARLLAHHGSAGG